MSRNFPALAHLASRPDAVAVSVDGQTCTWRDLFRDTDRLHEAWHQLLQGSAPPLLIAHRSLRFLTHFFALLRAGYAPILLSPDTPPSDRARIQKNTGACALYDECTWRAVEERAASIIPSDRPLATWAADRILFWVMTSGTTGDPRPIPIRCEQVIFSTLGSASRLGSLPNDCWYAPLPLHHVGGIMVFVRALLLGFHAAYTTHFDASSAAERLLSGEIHLASFVPVMLQRILDAAPTATPPATLRAILLGGAAASPALLNAAQQRGFPVARSWGMSETASQIATAPPGDWNSALSPLPFAIISTQHGALHIDGPHVQNGAFTTSDRGSIHEGRVTIHGRVDDIFISGGENIDPIEIENVLRQHEDIHDVLVAGVPSDTWGQAIVAFVVYEQGTKVDLEALRQLCTKHLQPFKMPKVFHIVAELPRNALGKPSRLEAQKVYAQHIAAHRDDLSLHPSVPGASS